MKKNSKKTYISLLILGVCAGLPVNSVLALSPKLNISSDALQQASRQGFTDSIKLPVESLPEWLNLEELENLKGLKITRTIIPNQVSSIDSDEGDEMFDQIKFEFSYPEEKGNGFQAGQITIWKYHRPEGVRLFLHKSNRYNIRVVTFKPNLPRGRAVKEFDGRVQKAGLGISMLWLLLARKPSWQDQMALIFNSEPPSQKVFDNLRNRWENLVFSGTPFYAKDIKLAPLVHVGFNVPKLTEGRIKIVEKFFENKIDLVDEADQKITIPISPHLTVGTSSAVETAI